MAEQLPDQKKTLCSVVADLCRKISKQGRSSSVGPTDSRSQVSSAHESQRSIAAITPSAYLDGSGLQDETPQHVGQTKEIEQPDEQSKILASMKKKINDLEQDKSHMKQALKDHKSMARDAVEQALSLSFQLIQCEARVKDLEDFMQHTSCLAAALEDEKKCVQMVLQTKDSEGCKLTSEIIHLNARLHEEVAQKRTLESRVGEYSHETHKLKDENAQLESTLKAHESDLQRMRLQTHSTTKALESCNLGLCKLKPTDLVTDADILKDLQGLGQNISHWLDTTLTRMDELFSDGGNKSLVIRAHDADGYTNRLCATIPSASEYLMKRIVWHKLQIEIFNSSEYLPWLGREGDKVLEYFESGVRISKAGKGEDAIQDWKVELLSAICATPDYQTIYETSSHTLACELEKALRHVFPALDVFAPFHEELLKELVQPAAALDRRMRLSQTRYRLSGDLIEDARFERINLNPDNLQNISAIDLRSRKSIGRPQTLRRDSNGLVGLGWVFIEPGLQRLKSLTKPGMRLAKPTAAIDLIFSLTKETTRNLV